METSSSIVTQVMITQAHVLVTDCERQWCQGRDLGGRGLPLINREDKQELDKSPPSILYLFIQEIY